MIKIITMNLEEDMRKCIRYHCEMIENYDIKMVDGTNGLKITKQGIPNENLGKVHATV